MAIMIKLCHNNPIGNSIWFPRCYNPPSPYKDIVCLTMEAKYRNSNNSKLLEKTSLSGQLYLSGEIKSKGDFDYFSSYLNL